MALPARSAINTAINNLYAAFAEDKTKSQAGYGVGIMNKMIRPLREMYNRIVLTTVAVTDATEADLGVFFTSGGELFQAFTPTRAAAIGDIFDVAGTGDTTDNALQAAKGSAPAAGDQFQVTNITAASEAVVYLGLATDFDFSDEDSTDFIGL